MGNMNGFENINPVINNYLGILSSVPQKILRDINQKIILINILIVNLKNCPDGQSGNGIIYFGKW